MNIRLGAQVLSSTVSKILSKYGPPEASGTARNCMLVDALIDITNTKKTRYREFQRKPSLRPFTSIIDQRFS